MSNVPRPWSVITVERFEAYMTEAQQLARAAEQLGIHPFAAAIAGVSFIRNALTRMGGDIEWWIDFVRTGELPLPPQATTRDPPS